MHVERNISALPRSKELLHTMETFPESSWPVISTPLVSCLMATHGRVRWVQDALSCFLMQDYPTRELIILNNHPTPLVFSHPLVTIRNETGHLTLGHCRKKLVELARGDFVRTWDDDDLYLPWSIRQGVEQLEQPYAAFKPQRSWFSQSMDHFELIENVFEAAILALAHVAKKYGYKASGGDEHEPLLHGIVESGGEKHVEFGCLTGYIYRWGWGTWHISGSLGNESLEARTDEWVKRNQDAGDGKSPLIPSDLTPVWRALVQQAEARYGEREANRLRSAFKEAAVVL